MKLSILIPTHNRPYMFNRCLESVIKQLGSDIGFDVEVIVNNDTKDINEWQHPNIQYHYFVGETVSDVYKFLLEKSTGDYVYFLEDDDYLANDFFTELALSGDVIAGNYYPTWNEQRIIPCSTMYGNKTFKKPLSFLKATDSDNLQLSQYVFKRDVIKEFPFPNDNNIHNDINLLMFAIQDSTNIKTMKKVFFFQTMDGGDNMSFPETTSTVAVTKSMDFVSNYAFNTEMWPQGTKGSLLRVETDELV